MKVFSISRAKSRLARITRDVEAGGTVMITRRGEAVAVLISPARFDRLRGRKRPIDWGALEIDTRQLKFDRDEANAR